MEYEIEGINQAQIKPAIGLTFATALRAFLRHDPDVIMVGEVRDSETAHIAIHAALTGHLVLTTASYRDGGFGDPATCLILASRTFCWHQHCAALSRSGLFDCCAIAASEHDSRDERSSPPIPATKLSALRRAKTLYEPERCDRCGGTGYRGRNGLFEIIEVNDEIRRLIGPTKERWTKSSASLCRPV